MEKENQAYITQKVHPIYEKMLIDLLLNKPEDIVKNIFKIKIKLDRLYDHLAKK